MAWVHIGWADARSVAGVNGWALLDLALAGMPFVLGLIALVWRSCRAGVGWERALGSAALVMLAATVVSFLFGTFWM
jgi:hypothetical protein